MKSLKRLKLNSRFLVTVSDSLVMVSSTLTMSLDLPQIAIHEWSKTTTRLNWSFSFPLTVIITSLPSEWEKVHKKGAQISPRFASNLNAPTSPFVLCFKRSASRFGFVCVSEKTSVHIKISNICPFYSDPNFGFQRSDCYSRAASKAVKLTKNAKSFKLTKTAKASKTRTVRLQRLFKAIRITESSFFWILLKRSSNVSVFYRV